MFRRIQPRYPGKRDEGIGWGILPHRFKKAFLIVILHDLRKQSPRFTKSGDLLGVALSLCFLFCQYGNTIHRPPSFLYPI